MGHYNDAVKACLARFRTDMGELNLVVICETEKVQCYQMRKPGTGINRVQITFTPEGIAIQGDLCPCGNGSCSSRGYGLAWFTGHLSPSYLAEKFLRQALVPESQIDFLLGLDELPEKDKADRDALVLRLRNGELSASDYYDGCCDDLRLDGADLGGYDYQLSDLALLQAIQERFAALYADHIKASSSATEGAA